MHDLTSFEDRLAERLDAELTSQVGAFDAAPIAVAAMRPRTARDLLLTRLGMGQALPLQPLTRRVVLGLVAAALVLVTLALAVGFSRVGGERLALVRSNGDVVVAAADGSGQHVIAHLPMSSLYLQLAWAPDGSHLAFVGDDWQLTVVERSGVIAYERHLDHGFSHFAFSPDGRQLAVLDGPWITDDDTDGPPVVKPHLEVLGPNGAVDRAIALPDDFRYVTNLGAVAWSPDGRQLAITGFGSDHPAVGFPSSIWIVDLTSGAVREIETTAGASDFYPRWLPDGRILFSRQSSGIWQLDPATGAESIVYEAEKASDGTTSIETMEPSPDGARVAFIAPNVGLGVVDLATGVLHTHALPRGGGWPPVQWSPDRRSLITRWGADTTAPFWPTSVAQLDIETGELTVLADDVVAFDVRH